MCVWILGWVVVVGLIAIFAIRERRSGRGGSPDLSGWREAAARMRTAAQTQTQVSPREDCHRK
jgi:hypothetical protein